MSSESRQWLAQCGLTVEQLARQVEPEYTPARKVHFYHCDHRGLPLALISEEGNTVWSAEYDEWGNLLNEENPHHLHQPYRFRLVLTTQAQRAEEARTSSLSSSDSSRPLSASPFPDTLPGTEYGPDRGIRLSAVWLMHDPAYPESLPGAPLARYTYTEAGELLAVYDRSNTQVRAFTYDAQHPGRMVAHRYAGRPEMRYRYDDTGAGGGATEPGRPELPLPV